MAAAGLGTPDISILSEEFLAEIQQMEKKNLALEALKKLLNDEITSRSRSNVVETKRFSDRLEQAVARYHTNAISTVEVIQELINLAREIREARKRGEDEGLSMDEVAFYDALAENESAIEVMGNDSLKLIAHELLSSLRSNITVDWSPGRALGRECGFWSNVSCATMDIRQTCKMLPCRRFCNRLKPCPRNGLHHNTANYGNYIVNYSVSFTYERCGAGH